MYRTNKKIISKSVHPVSREKRIKHVLERSYRITDENSNKACFGLDTK